MSSRHPQYEPLQVLVPIIIPLYVLNKNKGFRSSQAHTTPLTGKYFKSEIWQRLHYRAKLNSLLITAYLAISNAKKTPHAARQLTATLAFATKVLRRVTTEVYVLTSMNA